MSDRAAQYEIDADRGVLYATLSAPLCVRAAVRQIQAVFADRRFAPDLRGFIDARRFSGLLPSLDELRELARILRPILLLPIHRRCAIVVSGDEELDRAREFERLTAHTFVQFRAFDDDAAAQAWLGVPARRATPTPTSVRRQARNPATSG